MNADPGYVHCLVERLANRLPYRTGAPGDSLLHDEIVLITHTTLVKVSASSIVVVLDTISKRLEELSHPYSKNVATHPTHVLLSELYLLALLADCCSSHWEASSTAAAAAAATEDLPSSASSSPRGGASAGSDDSASRRKSKFPPPVVLDASLVRRLFDTVKIFLNPTPDGQVLSAKTILDDYASESLSVPSSSASDTPKTPVSARSEDVVDASQMLDSRISEIETHIKIIVEYVTASSWKPSMEYLKGVVHKIRTVLSAQAAPTQTPASADEEQSCLVVLRLVAYFSVSRQKMGQVLQEICSSFLHFRKQFQNAVAIATPLLIIRWIERFPHEFVELHLMRLRVDNTAETLFDMAQTIGDNNRRKTLLFPMQTALLFLTPDVFEVATNLREARGGGMVKKVTFLEGLRKMLRNKNDQAAYCLVTLLRVARHFDIDGDAAIVSYAMDFQDEVRDAIFYKAPGSPEPAFYDQDLITASFVSLTHLNFEMCMDSLCISCISPTAPQAFKIAVIQACSHFARLETAKMYEPLYRSTSAFIQSQMRLMSTHLTSTYASASAIQQRSIDYGVPIPMICSILEFLTASPATLFQGEPEDPDDGDTFFQSNIEAFMACMVVSDESVRQLAIGVAPRLFTDEIVARYKRTSRLGTQRFKTNFWKMSSLVLSSMCDKISPYRLEAGLRSMHGYLASRLLLIKSVRELSELSEEVSERTACSTKLETLFLVSLCSSDIETCQIVTSCICLFLEECQIIDASAKGVKSPSAFLRNADVFSEIGSKVFRFTGLVAFQRRINGLLRKIQYPSSSILFAWEIAFEKWLHLSKDVSTLSSEALSEKTLVEWRNYSGFLASLGGVCTADQASMIDEPTVSGLRWIDRVSSESSEDAYLDRFLRIGIRLLSSSNVRVRETMRESFSTEISPSLFQPLFKTLDSELDTLFTGALEQQNSNRDGDVAFVEQSVSLLRILVERLDSPSDLGAASSIHLGALTLNFAKLLLPTTDTPKSLRVKIKICQLCEAVTKKKEHLNFRDDVVIRNQLLEIVFGWIARTTSTDGYVYSGTAANRQEEILRIQKDLDKACLKCLAELTYRLPLQPSDSQSDVGSTELKTQLFEAYFNRFLSLLNIEQVEYVSGAARDETSSSELAITILSNLLSANLDVGLERSLIIGYHEDVEIRTAFIRVLSNILTQGTELSNLSDTAVSDKYDELIDIITNDTSLATAMAAMCPSSEVDELTISLLNIFESRGLGFELLEAVIKLEVEETESESELLRRSCVATKMLSVYAKWKGSAYLKATLRKVLERLMMTSSELDFELDPARVRSPDELHSNTMQLQIVAKVFIDDICASSSKIPTAFRKICSIILSAVTMRFPEAKYTGVGAFIFLRFFCPAIVSPEVEGLVPGPPSKEMRRGLLLIAKIIQNLANNVLFGAKEPYMYPLNDFLSENIYYVTTFLRKISVAPETVDGSGKGEVSNFGAAVSVHRFLCDHWDHIRQRLTSQERRDFVRSPGEGPRTRSPVLEPLRNLITNLGPPPMAITWNRPQITLNTPPAYSQFQTFMLRNAFRSGESYITARAIFDGGETKDGVSLICIVLRHIDTDSIDYDTLVYCYLKIASRLWHKPFGLLIDATCYAGQNEPPDDVFHKLEALTPTELYRQFTRIYVYNMNSAFRKCFRRILRTTTKNEGGVFHPDNVEYRFHTDLQEMQADFHLSHLHLPRDTISLVGDAKYIFQQTTRISKSRGEFDVVIKVGNQFVQLTTMEKQEIHQGFGLSAHFNDIFRISEIETALVQASPDNEPTFGLRTDNGRVLMHFTSPQKQDIIQAIKAAKAKATRDVRRPKSLEGLVRPQDVPGTLLNLSLASLSSADHTLRYSSYNLLGALCHTFKFSMASNLLCIKDISVPLDPTRFIINISKVLAQSEPQLTFDFLNDFFKHWRRLSEEQKPLSLAYMAPWIPGLRTSLLATDAESDKSRDKISAIFRELIGVALGDSPIGFVLEQTVWPAIYQDETLLDIFVEELVKKGLSVGIHGRQAEILGSVITGIGTITIRGKIISRIRKALNRSSMQPTAHLPDNTVWAEICVLLQFCVSLSFDSGVQAQLYLPEIFHIVTMLANTGAPDVRILVHRLLANTLHSVCTSFDLDEMRHSKLRGALESLSDGKGELFSSHISATLGRDGASITTNQDVGLSLAATESLAGLLFELCSVAAPSVDVANTWRARWMSLVASTAFQLNPAIQPRAFTVMGCLAREEVDDDLLYQVLVALRTSIVHFRAKDSNSDMLVAIVTSLSKMMAKLQSASRYGYQLFWLSVSLLRLVPPSLFNCTAQFLESVLTNISTLDEMRGDRMVPFLLQGRAPLEEAALQLDEAYGIHFTRENFHFAACSCLVRGLTDTVTRSTALRVLSTMLELTSWTPYEKDTKAADMSGSPYLAMILARVGSMEELKDSLWHVGTNPAQIPSLLQVHSMQDLKAMKEKDLLLNTAMELVDFQFLEDSLQHRTLLWLSVLAKEKPNVVLHLCSELEPILDDVLSDCQNSSTLDAAHELVQTLSSNPKFSQASASSDRLKAILHDLGFGGLWRSCALGNSHEGPQDNLDDLHEDVHEDSLDESTEDPHKDTLRDFKHCVAWTDQLIGLIIN